MSFTLRNLFSEEDGEPGAEWPGAGGGNGSRENTLGGRTAEVAAGQAYLVSEILQFIPPAIMAGGTVPMQKEVRIPLGKDGSTDVSLSTIFRQCPELFDTEITPLNDSMVTLPVKLGKGQATRKVGSSIFDAPSTPFGSPGFGLPATDSSVPEAEDNPFWSPEAEGPETAATPSRKAKPDAGFSGGFAAEVSQKEGGNASGEPTPSRETETPPLAGRFVAPEKAKTGNPFGDEPVSSAEKPSSGFSGNPFDSNESFSTLFSSKAEEDADIPYPGSGGDESTWGAMFDSDLKEDDAAAEKRETPGLGEMIKQNDVNNQKAAPPGAPTSEPAGTTAPKTVPQGHSFAAETPPEPTPVKEVPRNAFSFSFSSFAESVTEAAPVPSFQTPAPVPAEESPVSFSRQKDESVFGDGKAYSSVRETLPPPPEAPAAGTGFKVEEEEFSTAAKPSMPGEMEVHFRDLEFRAIFSSNDSFTLAEVARNVVALEGVSACALATTAKLVQASGNEQSRLGDEAREMVNAIRNLTKLTGLPEASFFTLQTDRSTVSLFLEGECCVTVNHDPSGFGPGVREKLILIARNIHKLRE